MIVFQVHNGYQAAPQQMEEEDGDDKDNDIDQQDPLSRLMTSYNCFGRCVLLFLSIKDMDNEACQFKY